MSFTVNRSIMQGSGTAPAFFIFYI